MCLTSSASGLWESAFRWDSSCLCSTRKSDSWSVLIQREKWPSGSLKSWSYVSEPWSVRRVIWWPSHYVQKCFTNVTTANISRRVVEWWLRKCSAGIGYNLFSPIRESTAPNPVALASVLRTEGLVMSGCASSGDEVNCCSSWSNTSCTCSVHLKFTFFFSQSVKWFSYCGKIPDEPTVIIGEAEELLYVLAGGWSWPCWHCVSFQGQLQSLLRCSMSQKCNRFLAQGALAWLQFQACLP